MKTALVVDDSRVARAVLRKTLVEYGVAVDEVPSAEAAIEYLKIDRPDVIFLDHQMPGMDGFDALGVLKTNPGTATIPVMMYTSQEGQFYVSQARALGAVDVLPKNLAPADVERLLRSHHLIGEPRVTPVDRTPIDDHHALIARFRAMLDEQAAMLMSEFKHELERAQADSAALLRRAIDESAAGRASQQFRLVSATGVAVLAVAIAVGFPYLRGGLPPDSADASARVAAVDAAAVSPANVAMPQPSAPIGPGPEDLVEAAARTWSFTQHYPHDAVPLGDERARDYAPLLLELRNEGFVGTVSLDIHEGRYCVNYAADGSSQLAPPDQPAATCDYIGPLQSGAGSQSPMFRDLVASATRDSEIEIDTVSHGASEPIIDYPVLDYSVTAGYWNSIADINQRISMRVSGEGAAASGERFAHLVR